MPRKTKTVKGARREPKILRDLRRAVEAQRPLPSFASPLVDWRNVGSALRAPETKPFVLDPCGLTWRGR